MVDAFSTQFAYDPETEQLVKGATFEVFAVDDTSYSTPLAVTDPVSGAAINPLKSTSNTGALPQFRVEGDPEEVILKSGTFVTRLQSDYGRRGPAGPSAYEQAVQAGYEGTEEQFTSLLAQTGSAVVGAEAVEGHLILQTADGNTVDVGVVGQKGDPGDPGQGVPPLETGFEGNVILHGGSSPVWGPAPGGSWDSITGKPVTYPHAQHNHTIAELRNGSSPLATFIMQLLAAANPAAARALLEAAPNTVVSFPGFGTTPNTAMRGDRQFTAAEITAPANPEAGLTAGTVQSQLAEAAKQGGTAAKNILLWRYASGSYPALGATKPAGIEYVLALGPVGPPSWPSWCGLGSGQAIGKYMWTPLP